MSLFGISEYAVAIVEVRMRDPALDGAVAEAVEHQSSIMSSDTFLRLVEVTVAAI